MILRVAIYVLATMFSFQTGIYLGKLSGPGRMTESDGMTTLTSRSNQLETLESPPCPQDEEIILEEPCPSSGLGGQHYPRYGPGKGTCYADISCRSYQSPFIFSVFDVTFHVHINYCTDCEV